MSKRANRSCAIVTVKKVTCHSNVRIRIQKKQKDWCINKVENSHKPKNATMKENTLAVEEQSHHRAVRKCTWECASETNILSATVPTTSSVTTQPPMSGI